MRKRLWCARPSVTADNLARTMGLLKLSRTICSFHPRREDKILNWGSSSVPRTTIGAFITHPLTWINKPGNVYNAVNKIETFRILKEAEIRTPAWTTDENEALVWLLDEERSVVCRSIVNGHRAEGLDIINPGDYDEGEGLPYLPPCPLYTKYIKKEHEYRLHVMRVPSNYSIYWMDEDLYTVIYTQKKLRRRATPDSEVNWQVRNHANGFIYAMVDPLLMSRDNGAPKMACDAVKALGLDFGAVDMVQTHSGKFFVLEINSAPMLVNRSLDIYVDNFRRFYAL